MKEQALLKMRSANLKIFLEIDMEDAFDYSNPLNSKYSAEDQLSILMKEIRDFRVRQSNIITT